MIPAYLVGKEDDLSLRLSKTPGAMLIATDRDSMARFFGKPETASAGFLAAEDTKRFLRIQADHLRHVDRNSDFGNARYRNLPG